MADRWPKVRSNLWPLHYTAHWWGVEWISIPWRFFVNMKFGMTYLFCLHIMCKLWPPTLKGQVTRSVRMTQHHLFATLRPHQNQSRWLSALKVAGCNELIGTYNLYISAFHKDDLRSGQFLGLLIISQGGGKLTDSFFTTTHCNINLYHGWHQSYSWPSQTL